MHLFEQLRLTAYNKQDVRPLAAPAQGPAKDKARYRSGPGSPETVGISSGNWFRTFFFFSSVGLAKAFVVL